jgi:hypothetical protein
LGKRIRLESPSAPRIVPDLGLHQSNPQHPAFYIAQGTDERTAQALAKERTKINQGLIQRPAPAAAPRPVAKQSMDVSSEGQNEQHVQAAQGQLPCGDALNRLDPQHPFFYQARGVSCDEARAMAKAKTQTNQAMARAKAQTNQGLTGDAQIEEALNRLNPQHPSFYLARGASYDEARAMARAQTQINQGLPGDAQLPKDDQKGKNATTIGYYIEVGYSYADAKRMAKAATLANQASIAAARARCQTEIEGMPMGRSDDYCLD